MQHKIPWNDSAEEKEEGEYKAFRTFVGSGKKSIFLNDRRLADCINRAHRGIYVLDVC